MRNEKAVAKHRELKREVLAHYSIGNKPTCTHCGFNDLRALSIDHINGNGHRLRTQDKAHRLIYRWLKDNSYPSGYQTLCMNCQFIKRFVDHENTRNNLTYKERMVREQGLY